jgi:hypothetical protein
MTQPSAIGELLADLRDLQVALEECDDPRKLARLQLLLASRQHQLDDMRRRRP